jgi:cell pole-organizing protein PopZ
MADDPPEPTMEEILASIRQVINADADATRPPAGTIPSAFPEDEEDVLELGRDASEDDAPAAVPAEHADTHEIAALDSIAIDPRADVTSLDGLVREMLRPMLEKWLDAHLPEMVEQVVAREVARTVKP